MTAGRMHLHINDIYRLLCSALSCDVCSILFCRVTVVLDCSVPNWAVLFCAVLFCFVLCCAAYPTLPCPVLLCSALPCAEISPVCAVLCCALLFCSVLWYAVSFCSKIGYIWWFLTGQCRINVIILYSTSKNKLKIYRYQCWRVLIFDVSVYEICIQVKHFGYLVLNINQRLWWIARGGRSRRKLTMYSRDTVQQQRSSCDVLAVFVYTDQELFFISRITGKLDYIYLFNRLCNNLFRKKILNGYSFFHSEMCYFPK